MVLPETKSQETQELFRSHFAGSHLPVIISTGMDLSRILGFLADL